MPVIGPEEQHPHGVGQPPAPDPGAQADAVLAIGRQLQRGHDGQRLEGAERLERLFEGGVAVLLVARRVEVAGQVAVADRVVTELAMQRPLVFSVSTI